MAGPAYQWGDWRFEPTECRLLRGGELVPLPAKTLDVLSALLRRSPRLVTKEEIFAAVWPDAAVEEGNIAFHVAALRKVLDSEDGPSSIETVRGRGYRFIERIAVQQMPPTESLRERVTVPDPVVRPEPPKPATDTHPVNAPPSPAAPAPARRSLVMPIMLAVPALVAVAALAWWLLAPQRWIIAVEPFEIVNPPAGQENFPDGLRTYMLTKLRVLGVETADREDATAVLGGQLHPADGGFGVEVQLTRVSDGGRVWDWRFDVPHDAEKPPAGQDDARSRLQGVISTRAAEGLARYLSLSGAAPVTR